MAIWVHFKTNAFDTFGYVKNSELDALIENDAIYAFKRESGWVTIGKDPIRLPGVNQDYKGPERRASLSAGVVDDGLIDSELPKIKAANCTNTAVAGPVGRDVRSSFEKDSPEAG